MIFLKKTLGSFFNRNSLSEIICYFVFKNLHFTLISQYNSFFIIIGNEVVFEDCAIINSFTFYSAFVIVVDFILSYFGFRNHRFITQHSDAIFFVKGNFIAYQFSISIHYSDSFQIFLNLAILNLSLTRKTAENSQFVLHKIAIRNHSLIMSRAENSSFIFFKSA